MFIIYIIRLCLGYVVVRVNGFFTERFLNLCIKAKMGLWNIRKINSNELKLCVAKKHIKEIEKLALASGNIIKIEEKRGLPFLLYKYRKRYALLLGVLIFAGFIFTMSSFIWSIEVTGNEKVDANHILNKLEILGFKSGILKSSIEHDYLSQSMIIEIPELSWLAINIKGTKAIVEVKERVMAPEILDKTTPRNIIAKETGQIISIETYEGEALLKPNMAVGKGEIIVSGIITNAEGEIRAVAARAKVMARTWYKFKNTSPKIITERIETGKTYNRYKLNLFNFSINLFIKSGIPIPKYDKIEYKNELKIGKDYFLPITIIKEEYREYVEKDRELSIDEQRELGLKNIEEALKQKMEGKEIVDKNVTERLNEDGSLTVIMDCECIEDIAEESVITEIPSPEPKDDKKES